MIGIVNVQFMAFEICHLDAFEFGNMAMSFGLQTSTPFVSLVVSLDTTKDMCLYPDRDTNP